MAYNRGFEVVEEQVADYLKSATDRVRNSENIDTLADLNKLFKKNVPLTVRKYVIAFMLKESLKHYHSYSSNQNSRERNSRSEKTERTPRAKNNRENREFRAEKKSDFVPAAQNNNSAASDVPAATSEEHPRHPRVIIPESEAVSIFISIGKNRRVYPRDLVGILIAIAGIDRDRIGDIKVLANYSFVQLYSADAQTAIDKLNGYDYRGRKLAVSYSRQKAEEDGATETVPSDVSSGYVESNEALSEQEMAAEDAAAYAAAEKAAADKEPFGVN